MHRIPAEYLESIYDSGSYRNQALQIFNQFLCEMSVEELVAFAEFIYMAQERRDISLMDRITRRLEKS